MLLGSCRVADCAVTVLASVVSSSRAHSVIDAGALALSKDPGPSHKHAETFGEIFADYPAARLSETCASPRSPRSTASSPRPRPIGERLRILPNHSCLTVAQFDEYFVARGDRVIDRWPIHRAR